MPATKLDKFQGIIPRITDKLLPERAAQTAENLDLLSGRLQPIEEPGTGTAIGASKISAYLWRRNNSSEWLSWTTDVDVVKGPIADDDKERIYYIDAGTMKVTGWDTAKETRNVGLSTPSKPTVAPTWAFDISKVTMEAWFYQSGVYRGLRAGDMAAVYRSEDEITFVFRHSGSTTGFTDDTTAYKIYPQLQIDDPSGTGSSPEEQIPTDAHMASENRDDLYADTVELSSSGTQYAEIQVINSTSKVIWNNPWTNDQQWEVKFICKLNYTQAFTQYQYYVQTFVDDWGQESPVSSISKIATRGQGKVITVTLPGATPGSQNIAYRRIYRSAAGTSEDNFFFVAQVGEGTSTYVDSKLDSELSEVMPQFKNPESGMSGLIVMPGGFLAAFKDKTLYFTEPWLPYTWPTKYDQTIDYDVVAIHPSGNDIIVMTTGTPYIITGSHPELLTITRLMQKQACVAKRGVTQVGRMVLYPSPDGLVGVQGGQANLLTEKFYRKEDWDDLSPSGMIAKCYDKKYHGWSGAHSIIFDFDEGLSAITSTDEVTTGLHEDLQNDALYLIQGTDIVEWRGGSDKLKMTWRSKEFQLSKCYDWKVCRVISDSYPINGSGEELTMKLYADNVLVLTQEIFDENAFMLPLMRPERIWSIEVEAYNAIDEIIIATSMAALKGA